MAQTATILDTDEREGPATRLPEENQSLTQRTDAELPDTGSERGDETKQPWAPDGMFWAKNRNGDMVLRPADWYVRDVAAEADAALITAYTKFRDSNECKDLIQQGSEALREYLLTRKAINDKSFERKLKQECDDAAYQITQAAKYKIDAMARMRNAREQGRSLVNDKTLANLKHWGNNSLREGYILTKTVLAAVEDLVNPPTFDYVAAAKRVCDWSAYRLTESLQAKLRNEQKANELDEEATQRDGEAFFNE